MKKLGVVLLLLAAFWACKPLDEPLLSGSVEGKALFSKETVHEGIFIYCELTDGLRSINSQRDTVSNRGNREYSIAAVTGEDGSYLIEDLEPGNYTIYAESEITQEKAVSTNVIVEADTRATAADLNLTPTGKVSGKVILDGTDSGNIGFLVFLSGTSYMAATGESGSFVIDNIPSGSEYSIIYEKNGFTFLGETVLVTAGVETVLSDKNLTSADITLSSDVSGGIVWKGTLESHPVDPQVNWAYYNSLDKKSYLWNGKEWIIIAKDGSAGTDGQDGTNGQDGAVLYPLEYIGNGADSDTIVPRTEYLKQGSTITIADKGEMRKSGYNFTGWNTSPDGSGTAYAAGSIFTMGAAVSRLYAQWSQMPPFISHWIADWNPVSDNYEVTLPMVPGGTYDFTVDWGNGNTNYINSYHCEDRIYTGYDDDSTEHTITITGVFEGFKCDYNNKGALQDISQWGPVVFGRTKEQFSSIDTLVKISATDTPDFSRTTSFYNMFGDCFILEYITAINDWDTSSITDMSYMFSCAEDFNDDFPDWDTSNVTNMNSMFYEALVFNGDISGWDTSNVTDMGVMFSSAELFNQDISSWDTDSVTNMAEMFYCAYAFNQDISEWDVSKVTNMSHMFASTEHFNQNLNSWDTGLVTNMSNMFYETYVFNNALDSWNTSSVTDMSGMFHGASLFNQNLVSWNTSNVTSMSRMFTGATQFNQSLGGWDITGVTDMAYMLDDSGLSEANYNATLTGWESQSVQNNVRLGASGLYYTANTAHTNLENDHSWIISGDIANF